MSTPLLSLPQAMRTLAAFTLVTVASAQSLLAPKVIPLETLAAFRQPGANWQVAGGLTGNPRTEKSLEPIAGTGVLINNPTPAARSHLIAADEHGDAEVDVDFLLTPGSNSGVYLMGRYEVQLFDSWGVAKPTAADCGAIYERWNASASAGQEGYEGHAPRANASRAPGLWQKLHIEFRAPRFDAAGKKTANARFVKVMLNDFVIHENVEVTGPTRSAAFENEAALGPLMIQGDHGAVALRHLTIKQFNPAAPRVEVTQLNYQLYPFDPEKTDHFDALPPKSEGHLEVFSAEAVEKNGKFAIIFDGAFVIPREGDYVFTAGGNESVGLMIDGQPAILAFDRGGQSVVRPLAAGSHPFRLQYLHRSNGKPRFTLSVEGPDLAPQLLTAPPVLLANEMIADRKERPRSLLIEPSADRVRLQRSFVPFDPKKRLYAINVGTPAEIHYAYDFETSALLRVWRGAFLDTFEIWDGRGENQLAKSAGPALTLNDKPVLALLETYQHDWPDQPDALWSSQGYQLDATGQPTFRFKLSALSATDHIAPAPELHGLTRTLVVTGEPTSWAAWVLLAEAAQITPLPGGRSYVIGDRSYYLDLPAGSTVQPLLRTRNGRQQLLVPIDGTTLGKPLIYSLVW